MKGIGGCGKTWKRKLTGADLSVMTSSPLYRWSEMDSGWENGVLDGQVVERTDHGHVQYAHASCFALTE